MPTTPVPPGPPLSFDLAAASALATALDEVATALHALVRADRDRLPSATADWRGSTRAVFDQRHAAAIDEVRQAALLSAASAHEVRSGALTAVAAHERAAEEARLAAARDLARLGALVAPAARP